jgi:hypothetical protein
MQNKINKDLVIYDLQNISVKQNYIKFVKIIVSLIVCAVSFGAIGGGFVTSSSSFYYLLLCAGTVAVCCFLIFLIYKDIYYVYTPTNSVIRQKEFFGKFGSSQQVISLLKEEDYQAIIKNSVQEETSTKVTFICTDDNVFARCQVFVYEACVYEPASKIFEITPEGAKILREA